MIKEINSVELNLALTKWFKNRLIDNKAVENGDFFYSVLLLVIGPAGMCSSLLFTSLINRNQKKSVQSHRNC